MVIDRILVACCRKDFYLTRICVASIRFWNKTIPIDLLKDLSGGSFDTTEMERIFSVGVASLPFSTMGAYSKLFPFISKKRERVLILDSDIVMLGNIIPVLEKYDEDILVQTYSPDDRIAEMNRWYFRYDKNNPLFQNYIYPGFLFNSGQMVINTGIFPLEVVRLVIDWNEQTAAKAKDVFICADQDIVNYVFAGLLHQKKLTFAHVHLYEWGWTYDQQKYTVDRIKRKDQDPLLLHWYGKKNGLLFGIPQNELLYHFEQIYFSQLKHGAYKLYKERITRTLMHCNVFLYELGKGAYNTVFKRK